MPTLYRGLIPAVAGLHFFAGPLASQELRGRVIDASNESPVPNAAVHLLDFSRSRITSALTDARGRFVLAVPRGGSFYLEAQSFGYRPASSPLLQVTSGRAIAIDIEVQPEAIEMEGVDVVVTNERMVRWLALRGHVGDPRALFGYRAIQGRRLREAKARATDTSALLRWLYIEVSHGLKVCVKLRTGCAKIFVDDRWVPEVHVDAIDFTSVVAVVALPLDQRPELHLFTAGFRWDIPK